MRFNTSHLKHWLAPAAKVIAALLLLSNALLWWLPDGQAIVVKHLATLTAENIQLTPFALWMGWGISTLHLLIMVFGHLGDGGRVSLIGATRLFPPRHGGVQLQCFALDVGGLWRDQSLGAAIDGVGANA